MKSHDKTVTDKKVTKMTKHYIRGGIIWLNYYVDGVRKQKSTKLLNTPKNIEIVTKQIIPKLDLKIASGEIYKRDPRTFEYYGNIYLKEKSDHKNYIQMKRFYDKVVKHFAGRDIESITRLDIKRYLMSLEIKSKNPYKTVIYSVMELAVDDGVLANNPALNIKLKQNEKRQVEYYTKEEVRKILSVVPDGFLKVYLLIAFNTGMRSGEILGLQLGDLGDGYINIKRTRTLGVVGHGKNSNATRVVPCANFVIEEAKNIQSDNIFLFGDIDGSEKLNYAFNKLIKKAEVKKLRLYCTRHTFATLMLQDGVVSINELAGILGHSSVKTTLDKYASVINPKVIKLDSVFSIYCDTTVTVDKKKDEKAL